MDVKHARDILVYVFLRGGCDALNFITPLAGEDRHIYEEERPNLKLETKDLLKLNDQFGLHPSAAPLHALYTTRKMAVVVAAGMTSNNRSHFDAQAFIELGTPDKKSTTDGWLARHMSSVEKAPHPLHAVAVGPLTPTSLLGSSEATAIVQPRRFGTLGGDRTVQADMVQTLFAMYEGGAPPLAAKATSALSVIRRLTQDTLEE